MKRRTAEQLIGKLAAFYTPKHGYRVAKIRVVIMGKRPVVLKAVTVSLAGFNSHRIGPWNGASVRLPIEALMWPNMECVGIEYRRRIYPLADFVDCPLPKWSHEWVYKYYGAGKKARTKR